MNTPGPATRLVVAVLTYRRRTEIAEAVPQLLTQVRGLSEPAFRASLLVVDNDPVGSARTVVQRFAAPDLRYVVEPQAGIAAARNRALDESCDEDLLVFIDDDELPGAGWLEHLLATRERTGAAAVAGTVVSSVDGDADPWIAAGGFFERRHRRGVATGTPIPAAATNNLLLDLRVVRELGLRFDTDFGLSGGEDSLFTTALTRAGGLLVWCAEAVVTERVPATRLTRRWALLRSLSSGNAEALLAARLAHSGPARLAARSRFVLAGLARLAGGLSRAAAGVLAGSLAHRARGLRAAARGTGMVGGAFGWAYLEYRREDDGARAEHANSGAVAERRA